MEITSTRIEIIRALMRARATRDQAEAQWLTHYATKLQRSLELIEQGQGEPRGEVVPLGRAGAVRGRRIQPARLHQVGKLLRRTFDGSLDASPFDSMLGLLDRVECDPPRPADRDRRPVADRRESRERLSA